MALTTSPQRPWTRAPHKAQGELTRSTDERPMNPAQRCDEIIRMIDEVLDANGGAQPGTEQARAHGAALDRRLTLAQIESRA